MSASELQARGAKPIPMAKKERGPRLIARAPEGFAEPEPTGKWSARKTLIFIIVFSTVAWAAVIAAIVAIF